VILPALLALIFGQAASRAQTTINLGGTTRVWNATTQKYEYPTWKPILAPTGWAYRTTDGYLFDPNNDQQTGQSDSDFAGNSTLPSFFIQFGQINGVQMVAFRVIFNEYDANIANGTYTGNPVNVRVGLDVNRDGKLDIYVGPNFQSGAKAVTFQLPGTGANISPSTTSTSSAFYPDTNLATLGGGASPLFNANNFNYQQLSTANANTLYPGWTTQPEASNKVNADGMMSWAVPVADLNLAIAEAAAHNARQTTNPNPGLLPGTTITAESFILWVAFTATQNNSVNQDAYGITKNENQDTRWNAFTSYMNGSGNPIPEPSAYGALLGFGLGGLFLLRRRPRVK
jgi:hypothetical protein